MRLLGMTCALVVGLVGCGSQDAAPVRDDLWDAMGTIEEHCDPFPNRQPPGPAAARRAVKKIAVIHNDDPEYEFRVEDSAEPTTASELLDDLRDIAREHRCSVAVRAIDAARR